MPNIRPRCASCGDYYSDHDNRDQNKFITRPCIGDNCIDTMNRGYDPCDFYTPSVPTTQHSTRLD